MKGIAIIPILLFLGVVALVFLAFAGQLLGYKSESESSKGFIDIFIKAFSNLPWNDVKDFFIGGLGGILIFLNKYIILPLSNFVIHIFNPGIVMPDILGYVILAVLILLIAWKMQGRIFDFTYSNMARIAVILGIVFVVGLLLMYMKII